MAETRERAFDHLPRLPPEVWDRVFDLATYVPYTLAPEIFAKASLIGKPYNEEYHPALRAVRVTKYNLVRVCKQWWYLATPYLYRTIYIGSPRDLLSLSNTLRSYAEGEGIMARAGHLGWWTQRLDVTMSEVGNMDTEDPDCYPDDSGNHLAEIIKYLPNLAIFSFAVSPVNIYGHSWTPPNVLHALRGCASSLRVLDWCEGSLFPALEHLEDLLMILPHLRILNCLHLRWTNGLTPTSILSSVSTLGLCELVPGNSDGHPGESGLHETHVSFKEIIVHVGWYFMDRWSDFMQYYGRYLTSIQLRDAGHRHLDEYLDAIKQSSPNIRRLTIFLPSFLRMPKDGSSFPAIEYLGLRAAERHPTWHDSYGYIILFMQLATLEVQIPTLSVVQLVDHVNVEQLCELYSDPLVRPHVDRVLNGMLRVQDHEGNPLSERLTTAATTP